MVSETPDFSFIQTSAPVEKRSAVRERGRPRKLALVIPTLFEAANLQPLLLRIRSSLDLLSIDYEVIVVDDDSRDGTQAVVSALADQDRRIRLLIRTGKRGLAGAVLHGWENTDADIIGVMDADLQHPPELVPELWQAIVRGADVAIASRYAPSGQPPKWNIFRHLISHAAIWLTWPLQPQAARVHDPMSGFFLLRRSCIQGVTLEPYGFKILLDVLVRGNVRSAVEIPFTFGRRHAGKSKANVKVAIDYFKLLARLWVSR